MHGGDLRAGWQDTVTQNDGDRQRDQRDPCIAQGDIGRGTVADEGLIDRQQSAAKNSRIATIIDQK